MKDNIYKDIKKVFDKDSSEQYCIVVNYWHQYAAGITGINRSNEIHLKNGDEGWKTKAEAKSVATAKGLKSFHKKGRGNEGYGDVGAKNQEVIIMSIKEALSKYPYAKKRNIREEM